ncbi:MAG: ribokinase [Candidatus Marinimicrobia bacterium]|nr:ribokinase [Candidatus Neomarinimicrobiota bacterium]MCF7850919.1 ribokinase [Candidatus Neomarinimicrobiota bacterium]MCF7905317.1 ribokinase [Candidatus Neomarinimicrobiota bacterium]
METDGILVIGSANMDLVVTSERFPGPGETILGDTFKMIPGGKGANQAVCAGSLGTETTFLGRVGNDSFGKTLIQSLDAHGVDTGQIGVDSTEPTGTALIQVNSLGENQIVVIPGSNMTLSTDDLEGHQENFAKAGLMLIQLEIPLDTVARALSLAKDHECITIMNPAPAAKLSEDIFPLIDICTPNEIELRMMSENRAIADGDIESMAKHLLSKGVGKVIVTLGSEGAMLVHQGGARIFHAREVKAVDTTGAGDAFNGALASSLATGTGVEEAIEFAMDVAAYCVTRPGAQTSMPTKHQIDEWKKLQLKEV